ncbi:MAG: hypothetical protein NTX63_01350 [Candidatus Peregrinibacteria bacterium]|nr:hypothetical protein [Candidatus Peregrinibacteria bacterium]
MLERIFHVERCWLAVYETFLARADRIPLLVELVRKNMPHTYESLLKELIVARDATSGFTLPSHDKYIAEKALSEVLVRVLEELQTREEIKNDATYISFVKYLNTWELRLDRALLDYERSLHTHQLFCLGMSPKGYEEFSWRE